MVDGILGKKIGMTQYFLENGDCIPVTVVETGPVSVIQKKTIEKDGYNAVQVGFSKIKKGKQRKISKPMQGHFAQQEPVKHLREFPVSEIGSIKIGQTFDVSLFEEGQIVDVSGISKGRGFSGVIKRHNFGGGPASHGHRCHRVPGSIGNSADPSKVWKNKKMPGQYGNARTTVQNLQVVAVKKDLNVLLVKGGIPGPNGRIVEIKKAVKKK